MGGRDGMPVPAPRCGVLARAAAAAGATAAALLSVVGCSARVDGTARAAAGLGHVAPPVAVEALSGLLPSPEQLDAVLGVQGMTVKESLSTGSSGTTTSDDCAATWNVAWVPMYTGSGWVAMRTQYVETPDRQHRVWQATTSFPFAVDATMFYSRQVAAWRTCDGRSIERRFLGHPASADELFNGGTAVERDGVLTLTATQANNPTWMCEHALSARNNVIVDVQVCGERLTGQAESVTRAVTAKVPVA